MRGGQDDRFPGWLRATLGTAGDVVLVAAVSLAIWTLLPAVALGATPVVISGGSMSPLIRAGDVVLLDDTRPPEGEMFAPGTVLTFEPTDATGTPTGQLLTHRVSSVQDGHYLTRGDANSGDDPRPIHPDQVVGAGRWLIPVVGLPAHWARSGAWHLVVLTALGGVAAAFASLAGRRRVVIEEIETEQVEEERPLERPLEPAVPQPVLAFDLEPATEDLPAAAEDEAMDPAAAERAAAIAAQAARRGLAGVDRAREEDGEERRTRRAGRTGGSAGSAPVASIVALALALLGSTIAPTFAAATFVATTSSASNTFTVADGDPSHDLTVEIQIMNDWAEGFCADVTVSTTSTTPVPWQIEIDLSEPRFNSSSVDDLWDADHTLTGSLLTAWGLAHNATVSDGAPASFGFCSDPRDPVTFVLPAIDGETVLQNEANANHPATFSWEVTTAHPTLLRGAIAQVEVMANTPGQGGGQRSVSVELRVDDQPIIEGQADGVPNTPDWIVQSIELEPEWWQVLEADTTIEVVITVERLALRVDGTSVITFSD